MNRRINLLTHTKLILGITQDTEEISMDHLNKIYGAVQLVSNDDITSYSSLGKSMPSLMHQTTITREKKRRKTMLEKFIKTA